MSLKASTRQVDGITVMDLSGRITLGEGSVILRDRIRELLGQGEKKILLNLCQDVSAMNEILCFVLCHGIQPRSWIDGNTFVGPCFHGKQERFTGNVFRHFNMRQAEVLRQYRSDFGEFSSKWLRKECAAFQG